MNPVRRKRVVERVVLFATQLAEAEIDLIEAGRPVNGANFGQKRACCENLAGLADERATLLESFKRQCRFLDSAGRDSAMVEMQRLSGDLGEFARDALKTVDWGADA